MAGNVVKSPFIRLICIKGLIAHMLSVFHSQPFFRVAGLSFALCLFGCLFLSLIQF